MKLRRTTIFIPGSLDEATQRDLIRSCGADLICLDVEDTVAAPRKAEARERMRTVAALDASSDPVQLLG